MEEKETVQSIHKNPHNGQCQSADHVLLVTHPKKMSFLFRYFLAFTPCILVFVSIISRYSLDIIISTFSTTMSSTMTDITGYGSSMNNLLILNGTPNTLLPGSMSNIGSAISYGTNISVLMIAPVGIFIIFAAIGWSMRIAEMWTSVMLTLGLSAIVGLLLVMVTGTGIVQDKFLLYLQWIAFLVQPFSILATILVIVWLEKFRQSIQYTITDEGILFCGGIWAKQEHLLLHSQIGRIVLEQNFFGTRYNFGTVIPVSSTRWGQETSFRGIGATGQKDNLGGGILFAKSREEASRSPLDCLYGIPDPKNVQDILKKFISQQSIQAAEQVSYLKKIYEQEITGTTIGESGLPQKASPVFTEHTTNDQNMAKSTKRTNIDEKIPDSLPGTIIRTNDPDSLKPTTNSMSGTTREIPPVRRPESTPVKTTTPGESIPDLIKKLAELKDAGIITEHEFETKKAELLKRL